MAKATDRVYDTAGTIKPYVERAMSDEKLRTDVMSAFSTARELYNELIGGRDAADRLQGKRSHSGRNTTLLVAGIALGILFNPVTGPETRKWLKEMLGGG